MQSGSGCYEQFHSTLPIQPEPANLKTLKTLFHSYCSLNNTYYNVFGYEKWNYATSNYLFI